MTVATRVEIETRWHGEDTLQCLYGETVVAETFWNGGEWIFFPMAQTGDGPDDFETDTTRGRVWISPDPELEQRFRREREDIALDEDAARRSVREAELTGRRKMYRDDEEMRDLVRIRSVQLARRVVRGDNFNEEG